MLSRWAGACELLTTVSRIVSGRAESLGDGPFLFDHRLEGRSGQDCVRITCEVGPAFGLYALARVAEIDEMGGDGNVRDGKCVAYEELLFADLRLEVIEYP